MARKPTIYNTYLRTAVSTNPLGRLDPMNQIEVPVDGMLCMGGCREPLDLRRSHMVFKEVNGVRILVEGVCDGCLKLVNLLVIDPSMSWQDAARLLAKHPKRILIDAAFRLGTPDDGLRELFDGAAR